jgi:hypothetical protein
MGTAGVRDGQGRQAGQGDRRKMACRSAGWPLPDLVFLSDLQRSAQVESALANSLARIGNSPAVPPRGRPADRARQPQALPRAPCGPARHSRISAPSLGKEGLGHVDNSLITTLGGVSISTSSPPPRGTARAAPGRSGRSAISPPAHGRSSGRSSPASSPPIDDLAEMVWIALGHLHLVIDLAKAMRLELARDGFHRLAAELSIWNSACTA